MYPRENLENLSLTPTIEDLKTAYEKLDFQEKIDWQAYQWDQDLGFYEFPLENKSNTFLYGANGKFFYRKFLYSSERRIKIYFDVSAHLILLADENQDRKTLYRAKGTQKKNFTHLNSRDFDQIQNINWADLEKIDDKSYGKDLLSGQWRGDIAACGIAWNNLSETIGTHPPDAEMLEEMFGIKPSKEDRRKLCTFYTTWYEGLKPVCDPWFYLSYYEKKNKWCTVNTCPGDILPDMQIAPTTKPSYEGARQGKDNRSKQEKGKTITYDHNGIDIKAAPGTDFVSMYDGKVTFAGFNEVKNPKPNFNCWIDPKDGKCKGGLGDFILVETTINGVPTGFKYGHTSQMDVKVGDKVKQGQTLGKSGMTGNSSSDKNIIPHVHIEALEKNGKNWEYTNPEKYLATKFDKDGQKDPNTGNCKK